MTTLKSDIPRQTVIEAYVKYDCLKKGKRVPDLASWDWSSADAIDKQLNTSASDLKHGILAGYILWKKVGVTIDDLHHCQVVDQGTLREDYRKAAARSDSETPFKWTPDRETPWHSVISNGDSLNDAEPLIIRPCVRSERAKWYLEDGSGRAMAFMSNKAKFPRQTVIAIGYLGVKADSVSTFMRKYFWELLDTN